MAEHNPEDQAALVKEHVRLCVCECIARHGIITNATYVSDTADKILTCFRALVAPGDQP